MNNIDLMHVLDGLEKLLHEVLDLRLCEALPTFNHFVHGLVLTELKKDVTIHLVFEEMLVLTNVRMLETAVDLNFGLKLLELFCWKMKMPQKTK